MSENREVKSDVFSMLMENKEYALEVYNVLNGTHYSDPELVEMKTLEKGISLSIRNDAAIIVDMNLNLYEHQSTYSPNMPLRSLIYFVDILKPMVKDQDLYGRRLIKIPLPRFFVLYNGKEKRPAVETMKLSDAFEGKVGGENTLELICTVYNINPGYNDELLKGCSILNQYRLFIEKVREYDDQGIEESIEQAMRYCIKNGILVDFLRSRGAEVKKAMTIDMTFEHREEIIRREEHAAGKSAGIAEAESQMSSLITILMQQNRMEDLKLAAEDVAYRKSLYKEFGI